MTLHSQPVRQSQPFYNAEPESVSINIPLVVPLFSRDPVVEKVVVNLAAHAKRVDGGVTRQDYDHFLVNSGDVLICRGDVRGKGLPVPDKDKNSDFLELFVPIKKICGTKNIKLSSGEEWINSLFIGSTGLLSDVTYEDIVEQLEAISAISSLQRGATGSSLDAALTMIDSLRFFTAIPIFSLKLIKSLLLRFDFVNTSTGEPCFKFVTTKQSSYISCTFEDFVVHMSKDYRLSAVIKERREHIVRAKYNLPF
jgi:hypothetical protein